MSEVDVQFQTFLSAFKNRVRESRLGEVESADEVSPIRPRETAFTDVFLEALGDVGQIPDLEVVHFEKTINRINCKVNAYGVSEIDGRVDLVVTIHDGEDDNLKSVSGGDIRKAIKKAIHVFKAAMSPIYDNMEPASTSYDMMEYLHRVSRSISLIRVLVVIDGVAGKLLEFDKPSDLPDLQLDIWDLQRLFRATSSGLTYETFQINFEEYIGQTVPCISDGSNEDDHRCYLAILPGDLLHDLYHKFGARLLELNVRSFLQARGKVNRGIRDTIQNEPGHFLTFNNGISATVEDIDVVRNDDGSQAIRSVKGLQIVNGGQTVASIHRARNRDKADLSRVQVQAKITVVEPEHLNKLVPFISRYANTQNRVSEMDFSANHPYHVKIQQLSMKIWTPGETCLWFYERARGQWEVARVREGTAPAKTRRFDQKYPRAQRVDKTIVAKAMNAWAELPHIVSLGSQKNFVHFMASIDGFGKNWEPDNQYFMDLISKIIIFKRAEKIARQIGFAAYRANATCFTVAMLAYKTADRVNLDAIWENQNVSRSFEATIRAWMLRIHAEIVDSAGDRNITEWCKKKECWAQIQTLGLTFEPGFEDELAEGLPLPTVGATRRDGNSSSRPLSSEERNRQAVVMRYSPEELQELLAWARNNGDANDFEIKLGGTMLGYAAGGWLQVPSPKQTKHVVSFIERWEAFRRNQTGDY